MDESDNYPKPEPKTEPEKPHPALTKTPCGGCGKDIIWAIRDKTGAKIPLDPKAQVFFVGRHSGEVKAHTLREFQERVVSINVKLPDGSIVTRPVDGILGVFVTHFATCPKAREFSQRNLPRK